MPTSNTGLNGRFNRDAPGYLGSFSPETIYLADTEVFFASSEANTDPFRLYSFQVKNDTSNAIGTAFIAMDGTTLTFVNTGGTLFSVTEDNAGTINVFWDSGVLKVQNLLASSAHAYVNYFRVDGQHD